jgi:dipeptidase E
MTVFLTSSPCLDHPDKPVLNPANGFVQNLQEALPPYCRALFIASDPDTPHLTCRFGMDMGYAFANAGMPFRSLTMLDSCNAEDAPELIQNSDFIILAGGHVPTQNAFFRRIHLRELLEGFGGTVMGISAGSMNAADLVYAQPELPGESVDPNYRKFVPGLGLTYVNILPHYQKVKNDIIDGKRLFEDVTYPDSRNRTFHALPDGSYLLIDGDRTLLCGRSYRLRNGILELLTRDGECLHL